SQNQIAEPVWMRDAQPIRSQRFHRRIHSQAAVRAIRVLPALVPVKRRFYAWIASAKKLQTLLDPSWFTHGAGAGRGERKSACRPCRNHDGPVRIDTTHLLICPVDQ